MRIENDTLIFEREDFDIPITEELVEDARRTIYRHGHWGEASLRHVKEKPLRYCPQCGAKMDEEENK